MKTATRRPTLKEFEKRTGIKFNSNMTGKMEGVLCLSTSALCNPYCAARRRNPASICAECYACATLYRYEPLTKGLTVNMMNNSRILTSRLLELEEMPLLNVAILRFEAFGDLINATQCLNYFRMAKANPHVRCALWTKNPGIVAQALKVESKPENLIIILSSDIIGERANADKWAFVDKVFTVYRKDQKPEEEINCGARSCLTCQRCYYKHTEREISEYLK